uniref:Uncharacterized protein n=1 Tax=Xiphophorus couchianus TaxID=32473 RepID=A0A3B5MYW9_9TELE
MHSLDIFSTPSPKQVQRADRRDTSKNKKNAQILSIFPVTQEPSIITASRLLGHHGLFNHEVKSISIERVLSEQSKLEQNEEKTNEENNNTPYLSSSPHNPILLSNNVSGPELWETNKCKTQESDLLDSFQNKFVNQTRNLRERLSAQQPHHSNAQPFFSHQVRHSADLHGFPQEQNPSKTDRFYFAPFFPSKSHRQPQSNHLQAFGQFSPVHQNFRPDPTDMMHYPPSHMLERNLAPTSSSLPSPAHWSFPPMRLY